MPETSYELYGHFDHNLDDKSRLLIPSVLKEQLGTAVVITAGSGKHARIYPEPVWRELKATLAQKIPLDAFEKHRIFMQRMHNNCERATVDNNGRLTLPRFIREWIGVKESTPVVLIGNDNWIEIWSVSGWETYSQGYSDDAVNVALANLSADIKTPDTTQPAPNNEVVA